MIKALTVIPDKGEGKSDMRYSTDRQAYMLGKKHAAEKLNRDTEVYSKDKRSQDCYNMGYSYGA